MTVASASSFGYGLLHGIEYRQAEVSLSPFPGTDTANHQGTAGQGMFGVKRALMPGDPLTDHFGIFIYEYIDILIYTIKWIITD